MIDNDLENMPLASDIEMMETDEKEGGEGTNMPNKSRAPKPSQKYETP